MNFRTAVLVRETSRPRRQSATSTSRTIFLMLTATVAIAFAALCGTSHAADATAASAAEGAVRTFNIPAQSLAGALIAFGEQSGVQFSMGSDLVGGKMSPGLTGRYRVDDALKILLDGSGLSYRYTGRDAIAIEKAAATGPRTLGPVRVQGAETRAVAANGSTDATATEGTGSYTSRAVTIGGKTPHDLKDTPQSVSVITQQRIDDQNLTTVTDVLNRATGITIVQGQGLGEMGGTILSRGFLVNTYQIDGGAPLRTDGYSTRYFRPNLAQYDHVEVLRGADGLFSGDGNPGGSINLVRKRALDHSQFLATAEVGRWSNYRALTDVTGPLGLDGALRGRFVTSYEDRRYFYDIVHNAKTFLFGVVEYDLTPSTVVSVGMNYERAVRDGISGVGLPRWEDGADLGLPRNTCFCTPWGSFNSESPELFARVDQQLGENWAVKVNVTRASEKSFAQSSYNYGPVNRDTLLGHDFTTGGKTDYSNLQWLGDGTLTGRFDLLGRHHEITFGANWANNEGSWKNYYFPPGSTPLLPIDVFHFDPGLYPAPSYDAASANGYPDYGEQRWGAYLSLRLQLAEALHLVIGSRYSYFEQTTVFDSYDEAGAVVDSAKNFYEETDIGSPKLALTYALNPALTLYASWAATDQSQANLHKGPFPGGKPLEPIEGSNYELGVKGAWLDGALDASLVAYRIEQKNVSQSDDSFPFDPEVPQLTGGHSCCYLAVAEVLSEGFEAEVTGQIRSGWQISAGYTFNENQNKSGFLSGNGTPFHSQTPKHLFKLWTTAQLPGAWSKLKVSGGVNAQSSNFRSGSVCTQTGSYEIGGHTYFYCLSSVPYSFVEGAWAVVDTMAEYQLDGHWTATLNVNNVLDKTYYQTVGDSAGGNHYGEPRNWMLTLRGSF